MPQPTPEQIYALAAIAWGLLTAFWGFRLLRVSVVVMGLLGGGYYAWLGAGQAGLAEPANWLVAGLGALLGAALLWPLYQLGVFLMGTLLGWALGVILLDQLALPYPVWTAALPALVFGLATLLLLRGLLIVLTAAAGAWLATGWTAFLLGWSGPPEWYTRPAQWIEVGSWQGPVLVGVWLLLTLAGILTQFGAGQRAGQGDSQGES